MKFQVKVVLGVAAVMGAALIWMLFYRTTDEKAIEELCREGVAAAEKGDAEAVIALLSTSFKNSEGDYAKVCERLRGTLPQIRGAVEVTSFVAEADGDAGTATVGVRGHALGNDLWRTALALKLKKENGVWKVVSAETLDR
jgi:hypothetical protein